MGKTTNLNWLAGFSSINSSNIISAIGHRRPATKQTPLLPPHSTSKSHSDMGRDFPMWESCPHRIHILYMCLPTFSSFFW